MDDEEMRALGLEELAALRRRYREAREHLLAAQSLLREEGPEVLRHVSRLTVAHIDQELRGLEYMDDLVSAKERRRGVFHPIGHPRP